jgi:flagellar hook-associated protein 1 FlgK
MLIPTTMGFFTAQRALITSQTGLDTVNHNIANANTPGYSRQRVEVATQYAYQGPNPSNSQPYQIGQGVLPSAIVRLRDSFLDAQYRQQSSTKGELDTGADVLKQIEGIVDEPSFSGLATNMQRYFDAIADMRNNPESLAARNAFVQQAIGLTTVFQDQGQQLMNLHENLVGKQNPNTLPSSQLGIRVADVNAKLASIAELNRQINVISASGASPNDLLDSRNNLVEELSTLVKVDVTELANNQVELRIGGELLVKGPQKLDTLRLVLNTGANRDAMPALVTTTTGGVDITNKLGSGEMKAVLDFAGNNPNVENVYGVFSKLSQLFELMTSQFNTQQQAGRDLTGARNTTGTYSELFNTGSTYPGTGPALMHISVNAAFKTNPNRLALAADDPTAPGGFAGPGDSRNAAAMAALKSQSNASLDNGTYEVFHQSLVARLGTDTRAYIDRQESQSTLLQGLDSRRQSTSGVNLDEENLDLIKYQKAYQAAARVVQTMDQLYQAILGILG